MDETWTVVRGAWLHPVLGEVVERDDGWVWLSPMGQQLSTGFASAGEAMDEADELLCDGCGGARRQPCGDCEAMGCESCVDGFLADDCDSCGGLGFHEPAAIHPVDAEALTLESVEREWELLRAATGLMSKPIEAMTLEERLLGFTFLRAYNRRLKQRLDAWRQALIRDAEAEHTQQLDAGEFAVSVRKRDAKIDTSKLRDLIASKPVATDEVLVPRITYDVNRRRLEELVSEGVLTREELSTVASPRWYVQPRSSTTIAKLLERS